MIRFYTTLLRLYIDENNIFEKSLMKCWSNEIKPYILQKYPIALKGFFNANSDLHYIVQLIDELKEKLKSQQIEEEKNKEQNNNNNLINTPEVLQEENNKDNKTTLKEEKKRIQMFKRELTTMIIKSKKSEEENIKILREQNLPKISNFIEDFIQKNKLKRANSMFNLRPHSKTIASSSTCEDSTYNEDSNLNINQLINKNSNKNLKNKRQSNHNVIFNDIYKNNDIKKSSEKKVLKNLQRSQSIILKDMIPRYRDEIEDEHNIVYKQPGNKLSLILVDIMIKQIIFGNFMKDNALILYHFCQQCFCFVNKEILFRKLIDCYKFYKKKNISIDYLQNLIEFINILIIEMFEYYQKIDNNDISLKLLKTFYNELIYDLLLNYNEDENENQNQICITKENKNEIKENNEENIFENIDIFENIEKEKENKNIYNINNYNYVLNKKNLINMNLHTEQRDIKIFILKEIEKEQNKDKEKVNNNKNTKDIKEDKKHKISKSALRNSISFKENKLLLSNIKKEVNKKDENKNETKEETETDTQEEEKKEEQQQQKYFQISRTLRKSQMIKDIKDIKDIILEEKNENSDEDEANKSKDSDNSSKSDKFDKYSDISDKDDDPDKRERENEEKLETINNLVDNIFKQKKIISIRDNILIKLENILLLLLDNKNDEEPSFQRKRDAKQQIPFYGIVNNLIKADNKKFNNYPQFRPKKMSVFSRSILSTKTQDNYKENLKKGYFYICDWKTEDIGDKLTQITKSLLNKIYPKEIYRGVFLKKDKEKTSPNVVKCINNFNKLTSFIIEDVLSYNSPTIRAKVYDKWVQVADYCKTIKNYNDCIAIYSALNNYIITGLKLTLREIKSKTKTIFEQISNFCACEGNYKKIREDMILCEKNGIIFIPYLGMLLRDINFYEESSKYINETGCINIEKIENINSIMEKYFRYKKLEKKQSNFKKIKILDFFEKLEDIQEDDLELLAAQIEPKNIRDSINIKLPTEIDQKYFEQYLDKKNKNNNPYRNQRFSLANLNMTFGSGERAQSMFIGKFK